MSAKHFIFRDFLAVAGIVTGSDVNVGTLLVGSSVCNREIYDFLIVSSISTITKRILDSKNISNRCVVYAFSTRAYFDVTSDDNLDSEKVHEEEMFGQENILKYFSGESKD